MPLSHLTRAPFNLDFAGVDWVQGTMDALSLRDRLAQLFVLISMGDNPDDLAQIKAFKPGGITRFFSADSAQELALLTDMQSNAAIPLLVSADLEGSQMSIAGGTPVLNPLGLAAIDDVAMTRDISRIMAEEALALGVNWSFTPFLDINAAWRSAIVATRGFGNDVDKIKRRALARLGTPANREIAHGSFRRAPNLVKDTQNLLPLNPVTHRRVLVISGGIVSPIHAPAAFVLPDRLTARGFDVTLFEKGTRVTPADFDLVLYLFGEETLLTRSRSFIDWADLMGGFEGAMTRFWHDVPTMMISFGYPYYLYDAPRVPTYINAYSTLDEVQEAVVDLMLGNALWTGQNPVDPFCGRQDAQY